MRIDFVIFEKLCTNSFIYNMREEIKMEMLYMLENFLQFF